MMKVTLGAVAAVCMCLLFVPMSASAEKLQFRQTITPLDCTLTTLANGSGTVINTDCDPQPPQIDNVNINNGRPIITGKYDAVNSLFFRVKFNNVWYTLGAPNSRLTATGNLWRLDFSNITEPFEQGSYEIILEMTTTEGDTLGGSYTVTITPPKPPAPETTIRPISNPRPPTAPNTGFIGFLQSYAMPTIVVSAVLSFAAAGVTYVLYRRYTRK